MIGFVRKLLAHPLTRDLHPDDPVTTSLRRQIIAEKPFLRRIYMEWYGLLKADVPAGDGDVLELGSGAGFIKEFIPHAITSEVFVCPGIDLVTDGQRLALPDGSLRAIVMTDVLHHVPNVRKFFAEATRTVRPGGVVAMVEPWVSWWSRIVYPRLHHEPFLPDAAKWDFAATGPLSGANGAIPWIVFQRDREIFLREFPAWRIETIEPLMPVRYMISGGISMRSLMPVGMYQPLKWAEKVFGRGSAMFAHVVLRRV